MTDPVREALERIRDESRDDDMRIRSFAFIHEEAKRALRALAAPVRDIPPAGWVSKYALPLRADRPPSELWGAKIHDDDVPLYIGPPCPAAAATRTNEVERDAARYRLLRAEADLPPHARRIFVCPPAPAAACASGDELDAAIDAALSEPE